MQQLECEEVELIERMNLAENIKEEVIEDLELAYAMPREEA